MDFVKTWIEVDCPKCNYKNDIRLLDIKLEAKIYCSNCKTSIHIKDDNV